MAINLVRRDAFSKMFRQYHAVLDAFIRQHVKSDKIIDPVKVKTVLLMQFVVRLIKARAKGGTEAINWFAFELTGRYIETRELLLPKMTINADDKYRAALSTYEQELANTIFEALWTEACSQDGDFEEVDFWRDIFIALGDPLTLQPLILDHMSTFKEALDAAPDKELVQ